MKNSFFIMVKIPTPRCLLQPLKERHIPFTIMYAMLCTRPDVAHAISLTSRYQSDPGSEHWIAVKNIIKYLRRTKDMFLVYGGEEELVAKCYVDASFDTDLDDSKSQSGYVFLMNGGAVSWRSSKRPMVAGSTTEAEYVASSEVAREAVWMKESYPN